MRFALAAVLLIVPIGLSAATIPCGTGDPNDSGPIALATVLATPGFACEQQDKIYSGFNLISGSVAGINMEFFFQPIGPNDNHTVQFSGNLGLAFALEYDITIDLGISPNNRLKLVGVDINASASGGNPTITKSSPDFATIVASKNTGSQATAIPSLTSVHVMDTYNPNGGAATSISNSFVEATVPEPTTMVLLSGALFLLGAKRKRKAN
jgi:hypothetical protein